MLEQTHQGKHKSDHGGNRADYWHRGSHLHQQNIGGGADKYSYIAGQDEAIHGLGIGVGIIRIDVFVQLERRYDQKGKRRGYGKASNQLGHAFLKSRAPGGSLNRGKLRFFLGFWLGDRLSYSPYRHLE